MSGVYVTTAETYGFGGWSDFEWWESDSFSADCERFSDSASVWVLTSVWISDGAWSAATDDEENVDVWNADRTVCAVRVVGGGGREHAGAVWIPTVSGLVVLADFDERFRIGVYRGDTAACEGAALIMCEVDADHVGLFGATLAALVESFGGAE